jgi:hypothetical protein
MVNIRNGVEITLQTLLKGIPAAQVLSHPFLFQHIKPHSSGVVTMAIYQKVDHDQLMLRQTTLEKEIKQVIEDGQERNVFSNPDEGIWFGSVFKNKFHLMKIRNMPATSLTC